METEEDQMRHRAAVQRILTTDGIYRWDGEKNIINQEVLQAAIFRALPIDLKYSSSNQLGVAAVQHAAERIGQHE